MHVFSSVLQYGICTCMHTHTHARQRDVFLIMRTLAEINCQGLSLSSALSVSQHLTWTDSQAVLIYRHECVCMYVCWSAMFWWSWG